MEIAYELLVMRFLPPPALPYSDESGGAAAGAFANVAEEDLLEDFADQVALSCACVVFVRARAAPVDPDVAVSAHVHLCRD